MRRQIFLLFLPLLSIAIAGCAEDPTKVGSPPSGNVPLHLLISNQSFDKDPVDIDVFLDGTHVITGDFRVEGQHKWYPFDFVVPAGQHKVRAEGVSGQVTLEADLDASVETWGVLNFWYYAQSQGGAEATPMHFGWDTSTTAPAFD